MAYGSYVYSVKLMGSCFYYRKHSITALGFGVTRIPITFQEVRPGLTIKRLNCQPTGTHPSLRSAWEWRSASRSSSLLSTRRPLLCIHWSQTGSIAPRHWVVTRGRRWLVLRPLYNLTVTKKDSMLVVGTIPQEPGLVSLETTRKSANHVTHGLELALRRGLTATPRVVTKPTAEVIMETKTSKPWGTSWFSKVNMNWLVHCFSQKQMRN